MSGELLYSQCDFLRTSSVGQNKAIALMERKASAQVWQGKSTLTISTIGCTYQLEKRIIF